MLQRYGITRGEAERTALVVGRHGQRLEGAAALNRVLDEIGGGWRAAWDLVQLTIPRLQTRNLTQGARRSRRS